MTIRGSSLGTPSLVALRVAAKAPSDVAFRLYTPGAASESAVQQRRRYLRLFLPKERRPCLVANAPGRRWALL